jgi:hypothetical protein
MWRKRLGPFTAGAALLFAAPGAVLAQVNLGTAGSFAVLAGSTVTNTGPTIITGNLGVSPGAAVIGFPPGVVIGGTIHAADAVAATAQTDLVTAYNSAASAPCNVNLTGQNLGGLTLTPGVYCFSTSAQLTGTLTLNALGHPTAVFILQVGSTLTTASGSSVNLINGGVGCNVFWQVGTSATLGAGTAFAGNILALTSITLNTGATSGASILARNGATVLDTSQAAACPSAAGPGGGPTGAAAIPAISPAGLLLLMIGLAVVALGMRRFSGTDGS